MTIGERIKARREELNMTQTELAEKVGYTSKSTIARIETGSNQLKQKKIMQFAKALNTTPSYLIGWSEKEIQPSEEEELLQAYRSLDEESKRQLVLMLAFLKDQNNKK